MLTDAFPALWSLAEKLYLSRSRRLTNEQLSILEAIMGERLADWLVLPCAHALSATRQLARNGPSLHGWLPTTDTTI